ncbi:MAG: TM2 domain-containing protein [Prevotella sp.]|nr:TM2 domain-containing protein [Prevotella sp.]
MIKEKIDQFLAAHQAELPEEALTEIRERLEAADDSKFDELNMLQFKNPTTMLIIAIFLGCYGVDRFMLGETTNGLIKLFTCGGCYVWWIMDIISAGKRTKEFNMNKLNEIL